MDIERGLIYEVFVEHSQRTVRAKFATFGEAAAYAHLMQSTLIGDIAREIRQQELTCPTADNA